MAGHNRGKILLEGRNARTRTLNLHSALFPTLAPTWPELTTCGRKVNSAALFPAAAARPFLKSLTYSSRGSSLLLQLYLALLAPRITSAHATVSKAAAAAANVKEEDERNTYKQMKCTCKHARSYHVNDVMRSAVAKAWSVLYVVARCSFYDVQKRHALLGGFTK